MEQGAGTEASNGTLQNPASAGWYGEDDRRSEPTREVAARMSAASTAIVTKIRNRCWHDGEELRWAVRHWATKIGVRTPQIHVRGMRTKWASLSTVGRLTLNTELLDLPKD